MNKNTVAIILASGVGRRFGSKIPKQFAKLNGKCVVYYVLDELIKSDLFKRIIVVIPSWRYKYIFDDYNVDVILGGKTRDESAWKGIITAKKYNPKYVLFHEAVRPLIKSSDLKYYIMGLKDNDASITYEPITDALYHSDRNQFKLLQSPEAYRFKKLFNKFDKNANFVSLYLHLYPCKIKFIRLNHSNIKITYQRDIFIVEQLLKYNIYVSKKPNLDDKVILIFGATGGIGKALIKKLNDYNCKVFTPSRKIIDLNTNFIKKLLFLQYNPDIIINVSGAYYNDKQGILKHYDEIMNINLKANLQIIEYAKKLNKPLNIVFISSSSATAGRKNLTVYSASKGALHSIIESQAEILHKQNINLNCICPEKVDTPLLEKLHGKNYDKREVLSANKVCEAILTYCDTKKYGKIIHLRKGFCE